MVADSQARHPAPVDQRCGDGGVLFRRRPGGQARVDGRGSVRPSGSAPAGHGRLRRDGAASGNLRCHRRRRSAARSRLGHPCGHRHRLRHGSDRAARQARAAARAAVAADRCDRRRYRRGADHCLLLHRQDQARLAVCLGRCRGRPGAAQLAARRPATLVRAGGAGAVGLRSALGRPRHDCRGACGVRRADAAERRNAAARKPRARVGRLERLPGGSAVRLRQCRGRLARSRCRRAVRPAAAGDRRRPRDWQAGGGVRCRFPGRAAGHRAAARGNELGSGLGPVGAVRHRLHHEPVHRHDGFRRRRRTLRASQARRSGRHAALVAVRLR